MTKIHEEVSDMIPDYLHGRITGEEKQRVEKHVQECPNCRAEVSFISDVMTLEAPDPGPLYWQTLPAKVRSLAAETKERGSFRLFFRPVPALLTAVLCLAVMISTFYMQSGREFSEEAYIEEPLSYAMLDVSDISDEDVTGVMEEWYEDSLADDTYIDDEELYSYYSDLAMLDEYEYQSLVNVLEEAVEEEG